MAFVRSDLATHVGSLVRPPEPVEFLRIIEAGEPYDKAGYETCLKASIDEVVRQQVEAGIDIVSDGEFSKGRNWAFYVHDRISGISTRPATPEEMKDPLSSAGGGQDHKAFPEFYAEYDRGSGLGARLGKRFVVSARSRTRRTVKRDIATLKAAAAKANANGAFLPVVAPASACPAPRTSITPTRRRCCSRSPTACTRNTRRLSMPASTCRSTTPSCPTCTKDGAADERGAVPRLGAASHRRAQPRAPRHPEERSRYHICWGSWNGPHAFDVPLKDIVDLLLQVKVGAYSVEQANPRHEHEWTVWQNVKLPAGKKLIPGVISHATNIVEHPELVAQRLVRLAKIVGRDNVPGRHRLRFCAKPVRATRAPPRIMWAKLRSLSEGARLASAELWGKRSAALKETIMSNCGQAHCIRCSPPN